MASSQRYVRLSRQSPLVVGAKFECPIRPAVCGSVTSVAVSALSGPCHAIRKTSGSGAQSPRSCWQPFRSGPDDARAAPSPVPPALAAAGEPRLWRAGQVRVVRPTPAGVFLLISKDGARYGRSQRERRYWIKACGEAAASAHPKLSSGMKQSRWKKRRQRNVAPGAARRTGRFRMAPTPGLRIRDRRC